jgi:hypothetical protein
MNLKEIKEGLGDCDWMRAFINGYAVDAVLWLMNRVEELEMEVKKERATVEDLLDRSKAGRE